jgi:hypothetical protein
MKWLWAKASRIPKAESSDPAFDDANLVEADYALPQAKLPLLCRCDDWRQTAFTVPEVAVRQRRPG